MGGIVMSKLQPVVVVIFGATGDLTRRKLLPALYNLYLDGQMPERFLVLGVARRGDQDAFRADMERAIASHSRRGAADPAEWSKFVSCIEYHVGGFDEEASYAALAARVARAEADFGAPCARVFYLSTPPDVFGRIAAGLGTAGLGSGNPLNRIVIEKPFGHDLASSEALDAALRAVFDENQIYRIDHYLGKETVQNIIALRFANAMFEPIWNRRYVDHVQITVAESDGVGTRGGYYDDSGALRDMVQNHLLQLLCLVAMEPLVNYEAEELRNKKVDVLKAVREVQFDAPYPCAVRGQYGPGSIDGKTIRGYRQERGVDANSYTETYAALELYIDNWRWHGVPFYLRTGKRMPRKLSQVAIFFRPVPHRMFPTRAADILESNHLLIGIQPKEEIVLGFHAKAPGSGMKLSAVSMDFNYDEAFHVPSREAYETLLLEIIEGSTTLFMRADQERAAWEIVEPVLEVWRESPSMSMPNYAAGTWGPVSADMLLVRNARSWYNPMPVIAADSVRGEEC